MVDKPPSQDELSAEDLEIDEDDDKLSHTMESKVDEPLGASPPTPRIETLDVPDDRPTVKTRSEPPNGGHLSSRPPGPVTGPPRPKSVRPPAPLPGPASKPLSVRPASSGPGVPSSKLPPPPPPRGALSSRPPGPQGKSLPAPRSKQASAPFIEIADPDTEDREQLLDIDDDEQTKVRVPSVPPGEATPPQIPSLSPVSSTPSPASHPDDDDAAKKRRGKKGKRPTVRIPDDDVPVPRPPSPAVIGRGSDTRIEDPDDEDDDDFAYDRPTFIMPEKDVEDAVAQATQAAANAAPAPAEVEPDDDDDDDDAAHGGMRPSAPGIFTDDQAIMVLRPIEVVSDLPSLDTREEGAGVPSARRPPPPRRSDRPDEPLDAIEEVIPERMSLPGFAPVPDPEVSELDSRPRRPLPPPRSAMASDPGLLADAALVEPISQPQPTGFDALQGADSQLAAAEAAAQKAEAAAREAEARAREAAARAQEAAKRDTKRPKKPWWVEMFEGDYIRTLDNPKRRDVEKETDFIEKSLGLEKGSRVLDLACGHGVHAVELSTRGYQVVGIDISNTMLTLANEYNAKRGAAVSFIQGDMRELNLDGVFDGVYCWSGSFGYFDDQRNANVLERICRALRPGGRLALDVPNRDYVAPRSPTMAWFEKPGCVCMDEAKFDYYTSRLVTKRMAMFETGKSSELEMSIRLYTLHELGRMLQKIGFKVLEVSGHRAHRGAYFGHESPRILITSERVKQDDEE